MIARIRRWQSIPRDEIQEVLDHGRDSTDKEVKEEIYIRRLTKQREVDRMGVYTAFHTAQKRIGLANQACAHIAKKKKKDYQSKDFQQYQLETPAIQQL